LIKNSQPFGKKFQKTVGGIFFTHTVDRFLFNFRFFSRLRSKKCLWAC